jgi:hypothetical protein
MTALVEHPVQLAVGWPLARPERDGTQEPSPQALERSAILDHRAPTTAASALAGSDSSRGPVRWFHR